MAIVAARTAKVVSAIHGGIGGARSRPATAVTAAMGHQSSSAHWAQIKALSLRSICCVRCLRPAASPNTQLQVETGLTLRALRRDGDGNGSVDDSLPDDDECTACKAPVWCAEGQCTTTYCCVECRDAHRIAHLLLCDRGGLPARAPLHEFNRLANEGPDDVLAMTATLIADAIAEVLDAAPDEGIERARRVRRVALRRGLNNGLASNVL